MIFWSIGKLSNMHQNNGFAEKKYHGKTNNAKNSPYRDIDK
jgi:hypothetical protein